MKRASLALIAGCCLVLAGVWLQWANRPAISGWHAGTWRGTVGLGLVSNSSSGSQPVYDLGWVLVGIGAVLVGAAAVVIVRRRAAPHG